MVTTYIYRMACSTSVDEFWNHKPGGDIYIFLRDPLIFKLRPDLSINNEEMEAFSIEIINKNSKNILISTQCWHVW